jgi:Ca2+/Na+ antiporter
MSPRTLNLFFYWFLLALDTISSAIFGLVIYYKCPSRFQPYVSVFILFLTAIYVIKTYREAAGYILENNDNDIVYIVKGRKRSMDKKNIKLIRVKKKRFFTRYIFQNGFELVDIKGSVGFES